MIYRRTYQIEFNHCDPAGIVFYPRYFEIVNSVVENFFAEVVGYSFARMHADGAGNGVPTVAISADFLAPSRLGDRVEFALEVERIGGASLRLAIRAGQGDQTRLKVGITIVWIDQMKAAPWPEPLRKAIEEFMEKTQ